jgi:Type I phosphodiesterase / nucleotide pyrophosphatase
MLAVLVLDALSAPLLGRLLDEGRLPALGQLLRSGERLQLEGSAGHLEGSVHTTLQSGLEASAHGIYSPWQWSATDQRIRLRDAFDTPPAIWDRLGRAGLRSLLVDPYDGARPRELRGVALHGWQFTNRVALPHWPTPEQRKLARRFGRSPSGDEIYGRPSFGELLRLRQVMLEAPGRGVDAVEALLARESFELLWLDFAALHLAGHQFLDVDAVAATESLRPGERAKLHSALEDIYVEGDRAIGRLLERLPAGSDLILVGPSTMVAETDRSDMLPAMLATVLGGDDDREAGSEPGRLQLWRVRAAVPPGLRRQVARLLPDRAALGLAARMLTAGNDWSRTRAFSVPNDPGGGIRLNLRGRERDGIVDPGAAEELIEEVIDGLGSFADADGVPSIERAQRLSELEPVGPALPMLPDLIVSWRGDRAAPTAPAHSPRFGTVERHGIGSGRSGNHAAGAWALLVPGGSRIRRPGRQARIVDVAATACALLGADAEGLAGEPLLER